MWGKQSQALFWILAYIPVFLIGSYRYFFEKSMKEIKISQFTFPPSTINVFIMVCILIFTWILYRKVPNLIFGNLEKKIKKENKGENFVIKKFDRLNLNDYTFFLLTLILPLITVDYTSTVSLFICFSVVIFIITLLINIEYIIACPIFFMSKYKIWKVNLSKQSNTQLQIDMEVYVITNINDFFNREFRAVKLLRNVYFLIEKP